jgi:putative addiction module antidote
MNLNCADWEIRLEPSFLKEVLDRLNVREGDVLYLTEGKDGSFRFTATDPQFAEQMALAEEGMRKYRNALRELAK